MNYAQNEGRKKSELQGRKKRGHTKGVCRISSREHDEDEERMKGVKEKEEMFLVSEWKRTVECQGKVQYIAEGEESYG